MPVTRREFIQTAAVAAIAAVGAREGEPNAASSNNSTLSFPVRYHRLYPLAGGTWQDEGQFGFGQRDFAIPIEQTALVMVDCWNLGFGPNPLVPQLGWLPEMNPSMRAAAWNREVEEKCILPVLEAARRAGMTVVHAPGADFAPKYPNFLPAKYRVPDSPPPCDEPNWPPTPGGYGAPDWPPRDFVSRLTDQHGVDWRSEEYAKAVHEWEKHDPKRIAPPLEPKGDDLVVSTGDQLHAICRDRKILHLFYAGFDLNVCLLLKDYGVFYMGRGRGYNCFLLRDCVSSLENHKTYRKRSMDKHFVLWYEMIFGYTMTGRDLIEACGRTV